VKTESLLRGLRIDSREVLNALKTIDEEISPITDVRSTAEYRRYVSKVLVLDALEVAYARLKGGVHG
jgi:carbon-monoxide dehydrogenase medium subunit